MLAAASQHDSRDLRSALANWAYNTRHRDQAPEDAADILSWLRDNTRPVSDLVDAALSRRVLEAITSRLDGTRAAPTSVRRNRAVLINALDYAVELSLLDKNPPVSLHIIRTLIERLYAADRQIKNLALGNSRAKIADLLLLLSHDFSDKSEDGTKVNIRLTHQELADLAGLARETTTKLLNEFVKDEAILLKDREIEILNTEKLAQWTM